ncbi:MAG TPA: DNA mismatch repair protein MutS [Gemmatimonadaceae bacterium]|nr:DNA mismatch repair protein MutS [Gemmatimonadaceae bacterium]
MATPLMQQYREIKARHPGTILFFRMGDFYETFYEDAELSARVLGLTLTSRNNGGASQVPLAGVPVKAGPEYVRRLVQLGHRVSICEQVEDPKTAKGVVRREVVETITPGAAFSDELLDGSRNNFLCAMTGDGKGGTKDATSRAGIAALDLSTGELRLIVVAGAEVEAMLARLSPREMVVPEDMAAGANTILDSILVSHRPAWEFDAAMARDDLQRQFGVRSLDGFGVESSDDIAVGAAGALLRYVRELQPAGVPHLRPPVIERSGGTMPLDEMTRRNLELTESLRGGAGQEGTLINVLDRTLTPMGARLLRQWILAPLTQVDRIESRLDAVAAFASDAMTRATMRAALDGVRDVERLAAKVAASRITPRELRALGDSIARLPEVESAARRISGDALHGILASWDACRELGDDIINLLVERPPIALGEDPTVRTGFDDELDELRSLRDGGKDGIARIQSEERARTGINSLKVGYNRVFGYYIEVTNTHGHRIPDDYQRRQTLTGAERYVTPALKEYEERVLTAADRIESRERALFEALRGRIAEEIPRLQCAARVLAELDVLATFGEVAEIEGYVRPRLGDGFDLRIEGGRHPVVERMMPREKFIPNDVTLTSDARVIILTGPNMAGKSTVLRQIGLIVLMAQIGSFVPARSAEIGVVDRLFTRVGASDNLVRGQSTFMVEMSETSAILHSATSRSLVLLDEIGRGTSTYDGVSIAWAVTEHIHDELGCKTVFATHYHELTQLSDELAAVRNFNVRVREVGEEILFLHTLEPGGADRSYGIEVGRLAGLPRPVLKRARALLRQLEGDHRMPPRERPGDEMAGQLALFGSEPDPIMEELRGIDPNTMTPLQALDTLARLVSDAQQKT